MVGSMKIGAIRSHARLGLFLLWTFTFASAWAWAGAYEDWRDATELVKKGDYQAALPLYTRAIDAKQYRGNELAQLYHMRGRAKINSHGLRLTDDEALLRSAQSDLSESIKLNSKSPETYNDRGAVSTMLRDYESAVQDFTAAIALKADYFEGYNGRCLAFEKLRRRDEAIADCRKALQLNPNNWQPKRTLERLGAN
jgi:tetratricopeptide (TPR) repeat protein